MGLAICRHLARAHRVAVLDVDTAAAERAAHDLGEHGAVAISVSADVSDRASVDTAYDRVRAELGPIGIVVTGAAISGFVAFDEITVDRFTRMLDINLTGTFNSIQAAIGDMTAAGWGRIVTISSASGQTGSARQVDYSASKGGVIALTKAIAQEVSGRGITANTIPPFAVDTPMLRAEQEAGHLPSEKYIARMIPAGRLGTVDDIAATCAFLCSDEAGYITGQVIAVNGGAIT